MTSAEFCQVANWIKSSRNRKNFCFGESGYSKLLRRSRFSVAMTLCCSLVSIFSWHNSDAFKLSSQLKALP